MLNKFTTIIATFFALVHVTTAASKITFCCSPDNDLFVTVKKESRCDRYETPSAAIAHAANGSAVLILADGYPNKFTPVTADDVKVAIDKSLRLYVEFPNATAFPELKIGAIQKTVWERGVVSSDAFGSALPKFRILSVNDCRFLPVNATDPLLVVARVAGFDQAPYGLPKNAAPLLFQLPGKKIFIGTTKLSNFVTGRYAPTDDWKSVWEFILAQLVDGESPKLKWTPLVTPAFTATEKLPRNIERKTFDAAADWIINSRLLVTQSRWAEVEQLLKSNQNNIATPSTFQHADGSLGILEGYDSAILHDGTQMQHVPLRADCNAESAMVLALDGAINHDRESARIAGNLLDFVYFKSGICGGPRADPQDGAFGLIGWGDISPAWLVANYGDDDARTMMATIAAAASAKNSKWNDPLAKALIANFRTTGKLGFRSDRVDIPALTQHGWKHFYDAETVNYSPHFECYLWACNLWAYRATGYRPFFDRTTNAISMIMKVYPTGWRWGDNTERARMLVCLSWLIRLDDTAEHREWLMRVAEDLLKRQQPNGAIHEWLGGTGGGHYQIPQSNEAYGTGETPLIQQNGDPASDQLYNTGFALLGLHEAVAATHDPKLKMAEDKLAEFLCRIQTRSTKLPYLNGWWFRAFDDRRWEFWASSADVGWGAWSLEAGWAQSWTASTLALRHMKTSFWDFTENVNISKEFNTWSPKMLTKN